MTYLDKLKDPRWLSFRESFLARHRVSHDTGPQCSDCGESTSSPLVIHHRRYRHGLEPWQYADEDLLLICKDCHDRLHALEGMTRDLIRRLEPHECYEFRDMIVALLMAEECGMIKVACARAKNTIRDVFHHEGKGLKSISELMAEAITRYQAIQKSEE